MADFIGALIADAIITGVTNLVLAQIIVWGLAYEHVNSGLAGPWLILGALSSLIYINSRISQ